MNRLKPAFWIAIALAAFSLRGGQAMAVVTANPQSVVTDMNTAKAITLTATDTQGRALTYTIVTPPAHGNLTGTAPNITYSPTLNYTGPDSFTFRATNGQLTSTPATVSITVNALVPPIANNQSVTTAYNSPRAITLTATDPAGLPLTYIITGSPSHGTLSGTAPNVTYAPSVGYTGSDTFLFHVNDGVQDSNNATVSITIESPGSPLDPPTLNVSGPVSLSDVLTVTPSPCCIADYYVWTFIPMTVSTNTGSAAGLVTVPHSSTQLSLADLGLHVGTYQVHVHGVAGQTTSNDAVATLTIVSSTLLEMRVFPNPWRSDVDSDVDITFDHLTPGTTVKLFDMAGHWVRTLSPTADSVSWNRRNDRGDVVASGMYLFLITDNQGEKKRGKLTLIK